MDYKAHTYKTEHIKYTHIYIYIYIAMPAIRLILLPLTALMFTAFFSSSNGYTAHLSLSSDIRYSSCNTMCSVIDR